jgi:hypothetical protein
VLDTEPHRIGDTGGRIDEEWATRRPCEGGGG